MTTPASDPGSSIVEASVPWPPGHVVDDGSSDVDIDRLMVFVPAIMSVGLLFSLVTLIRELFHWTGARARDRRTGIEAGAVVGWLLGNEEPEPDDIGMLSRPAYLVAALVLVGGAAYVAIGSTANFLRDQGSVRDISWLLAISLALSVLLGFLGGVSLTVYRSWPHPPAWTYGPLRTAPLSTTPGRDGQDPSWALMMSTLAALVVTGMITLMVGSGRSVAMDIDRPIADWLAELEWLDRLAPLDPFGLTIISMGFVAFIGLSGVWCRVMAISYPVAFAVAWLGAQAIRDTVNRPRPDSISDLESFPSGHLVQAVFIAGLVPLAITVLTSNRSVAILTRILLAIVVVGSALHRLHERSHWPLDALAGITLGLSVVLATHWVMDHRSWHGRCSSCPWSPSPGPTPWRRGIVSVSPRWSTALGLVGIVSALAAAVFLAAATLLIGLPTDPEGYGFGSAVSSPVQIGLATMMGLAALLARRWPATAAVIMAVAATGLGLFASVEYRPLLAVALATILMIPAVLTWLAWQGRETLGRIVGLAALTTSLLTVTVTGSREIHAHYFGPTHPDSVADGLESEADWFWVGGVGTRSATVVAGGLDDDESYSLVLWTDGDSPTTPTRLFAEPDSSGVARFELSDLEPSTHYRYRLEGDDDDDRPDRDEQEGTRSFTTFGDGAQDLVIVVGSCARSGSNGAVFDAMVAEDPDLYLAAGDLHYANLESTDPVDHVREYGRALRQPGQSALFSTVPTAYVWDDHDFGPNDADASSVSRDAVSIAYRSAVPHYGVERDPQASIAQAFTVGRIRFVVSDTRSRRTDETMLGADQLEWLIEELTGSSSDHAVVVWLNPTPWIGAPSSGSDAWAGFPGERQAIAQALADAGVDNLIMVSGDAHMVAIDDGTNSDYSDGGGSGFPVLHAGALDRPGSVKGGPYSHGAVPGSGQYGRVAINDDGGSTVAVRLSGHNWKGDVLVELDLEFAVPEGIVGGG